jgi:hypothetical protein
VGARLGSGRALRYHDAQLVGIGGARSCVDRVCSRPGSVAQGGTAAGSSREARSAFPCFDPSPVEDTAHRRADDSTDRGVEVRRGHGSAACRRCQVRRLRRHGWAPFVVLGSAGRRRRRRSTHVDPWPERLANVRQERCRLVRHPAAVARGDRGDRLRTHGLVLKRLFAETSLRALLCRRVANELTSRRAYVRVRPDICAHSTGHLRPLDRTFAPARPHICARSTGHLRPLDRTFAPARSRRAGREEAYLRTRS